ncbi:hypothetical protein ACFPFQ_24330 [Pseudonocardia sp. GCM10023141]
MVDDHAGAHRVHFGGSCGQEQPVARVPVDQDLSGSRATVAAYLAPFRALDATPPPKPVVPKVRRIASWLLHHPDERDADEQLQLKQVLAACPTCRTPPRTSLRSATCSPADTVTG